MTENEIEQEKAYRESLHKQRPMVKASEILVHLQSLDSLDKLLAEHQRLYPNANGLDLYDRKPLQTKQDVIDDIERRLSSEFSHTERDWRPANHPAR